MPRPPGIKRERMTFTIAHKEASRLREISEETGTPMSRLIEDCIKALSSIHQPTQAEDPTLDPLGQELRTRLKKLGVNLDNIEP